MISLSMCLGDGWVDVAVSPQHVAAIRRRANEPPGTYVYLAGDPQPLHVRDSYEAVLACVEGALRS